MVKYVVKLVLPWLVLVPSIFSYSVVYDPSLGSVYANMISSVCTLTDKYVVCYSTIGSFPWENNTYTFVHMEIPIVDRYIVRANSTEVCIEYLDRYYTYRDLSYWSRFFKVPVNKLYSKGPNTICVPVDLLFDLGEPIDTATLLISVLTLSKPSEYLSVDYWCEPGLEEQYNCYVKLKPKEGYYVGSYFVKIPKEDVYWFPYTPTVNEDLHREYLVLKPFTVDKLEKVVDVNFYVVRHVNASIKQWLYNGTKLILVPEEEYYKYTIKTSKNVSMVTYQGFVSLFNVTKKYDPVVVEVEKPVRVEPDISSYVLWFVLGVVIGCALVFFVRRSFMFVLLLLLPVSSVYGISCVYDPNGTVSVIYLNNPDLPEKCVLISTYDLNGTVVNDTVYTFPYLGQGIPTVYVYPVPQPSVPELTLELFPWIPSVCTDTIPQKWVFMIGKYLVLPSKYDTFFVYCNESIQGKIVVEPSVLITTEDKVTVRVDDTYVVVKGVLPEQEVIVRYTDPKCTKYFVERFLYMGDSLGRALYLTYVRHGCKPTYVKGNLYSKVKYVLTFTPSIPFVLSNGIVAYVRGDVSLENVYVVDGTWKFVSTNTTDIIQDLKNFKRYLIYESPSGTVVLKKQPTELYYIDPYSFSYKSIEDFSLYIHKYIYNEYISYQPISKEILKEFTKNMTIVEITPTCTLYKDYAVCSAFTDKDSYSCVHCINKVYPPNTPVYEKVPLDNLYSEYVLGNTLLRLYKCSFRYKNKTYTAGSVEEIPVNVTLEVVDVQVPDADMIPINEKIPIIVKIKFGINVPVKNPQILTEYGVIKLKPGTHVYILYTVGVEEVRKGDTIMYVNKLGIPVTIFVNGTNYTLQPYQVLQFMYKEKLIYEWYDPRTYTGRVLLVVVFVVGTCVGLVVGRYILRLL